MAAESSGFFVVCADSLLLGEGETQSLGDNVIVAEVEGAKDEKKSEEVASGDLVFKDKGVIDQDKDELGGNEKKRILGGGKEFVFIRDFNRFRHKDPVNPGEGEGETVRLKDIEMGELEVDVLSCDRDSGCYKEEKEKQTVQIVHELYSYEEYNSWIRE